MSSALRLVVVFLSFALVHSTVRADVPVDRSNFRSERGVSVATDGPTVTVTWPSGPGQEAQLVLDARGERPLIEALTLRGKSSTRMILAGVDPLYVLRVGSRESPPDRPPSMSMFNVFFDSPARRPSTLHVAELKPTGVMVSGHSGRVHIRVDGLTAGPFSGGLEFTVYAGIPLVHVQALVATQNENTAFLYDAGVVAAGASIGERLAYDDVEGQHVVRPIGADLSAAPIAVRHRTLAIGTAGGSVAAFPPPHRYFFPRDITDNQATVWAGKGHRGIVARPGFGIRQTEAGGGNYVPWFNAPPGSEQHLDLFLLLSSDGPEQALDEVLKFTNGDRFPDLPGRVTFTSHWHMAITEAALKEQAAGKGRTNPDFVKMFKDMNVNIVHLAEFHGDGHPQDPGPIRLAEMKAMFDECRRLSDDRLVFLPGEEANVHLTAERKGESPGHWLYLFPRPVTWTMRRAEGQPFVEEVPGSGRVYHVGNERDMVKLLESEKGLAWTAHPRIKASNWAPDSYRNSHFFRNPLWLGGAWKAMPADLSSPRLGRRVLDLLDDMANWGARKYVPGEVDVFKIDHTHELYGHMNVNYLALPRAPRFNEDWTPVLDALRTGSFFVTTGEVLLQEFSVDGQASGSTCRLPAGGRAQVEIGLHWSFPMSFAEVISGDGKSVYRERIDLTDTSAFGTAQWRLNPDLSGRTWVRVEAWDVAGNGAFSQPVWLQHAAGGR